MSLTHWPRYAPTAITRASSPRSNSYFADSSASPANHSATLRSCSERRLRVATYDNFSTIRLEVVLRERVCWSDGIAGPGVEVRPHVDPVAQTVELGCDR